MGFEVVSPQGHTSLNPSFPMFLPLLLLPLSALLPVPAQEENPQAARVAVDPVPVHCYYDARTPVVATLASGTPVRIVEAKEPWSRIQAPGGFPIWVHSEFLDVDEGWGQVTASQLRARPIPSTDSGAYPLGLLGEGMKLPVLAVLDDWFQVQGPESLGAWVLSASLDSAQEDEAWTADWAAARPPISLVPPGTEDRGEEDETLAGASSAPNKNPGLVKVEVDALEGLDPATVAADLAAGLVKAEILLARHSDHVTRDLDAYSSVTVAGVEAAFSTVIWNSNAKDDLERARRGLARVDALRRFRAAALAAVGRKAELEGEAAAAEASAKLRRSEKEEPSPLETYTWVGWVEYRPRLFPDYPYAVVRGGRKHAVQSPDGRFRLRDFVGREVAVRGNWTRPSSAPGLRVLEISEIRVLPRR